MKRTIINIAIILTLVLGLNIVTAAPAAAATTHYVFPLQLTTKNADSTAEWSTAEARTGSNSIHLDTGTTTAGDGDEARIVVPMPAGTVLNDLNSISWWEYLLAGYPPHVDIQVDIDGNGTADDALVFEYAYNSETHYGEAPMPYGALTGAWYQTFSDDGNGPAVIDDSANAWLSSGPAGPPGDPGFIYGTLAEWKAGAVYGSIDGNTAVISLEIELDNWVVDSDAYVDDITVNGVTYYGLIQEAIDAATAGDTVNVAAGTYTEDLVIPTGKDELELAGEAGATIKGVAMVDSTLFPLAAPNTEILSHGVMVHGFTIQGPDPVAGYYASGLIIGASNVWIYQNDFEVTSSDNPGGDDVSQGIVTYAQSAMPGVDVSGLKIYENTFTHHGAGTVGYEAIYINRDADSATGTVTIADNTFGGYLARGITTERSNTTISDNTLDTTATTLVLSGIQARYSAPQDAIDITGNTVSGYAQGIQLGTTGQTLTNVTVTDNTLTGNGSGVKVRASAGGVVVNYNNIYGNASYGAENTDTVNPLDARYNYWGDASGPYHPTTNPGGLGDEVSDNVLYDNYVGDPGQSDSEDIGPGGSGTLSVDGTSVDIQMEGGQSGSFGMVEVDGAPGTSYTGMGNGQGIGKTIVINTTAADGTYLALIQMYYGDVDLAGAGIDEDDLRLYYDDGGTWKLAVEGNVSPPDNNIRWEVGAPPATPLVDADLGRHGIDTASDILWAVVNHNTDYSGGIGPLEAYVDDDWNSQLDVDTYDPSLTWHVDAFKYIQDAIDSCASGALINVLAGTYYENLVVDKANMTIFGYNSPNSVIEPAGVGVGIDVQAGGAGLTLDRLVIRSGASTTYLVQLTGGPSDVTIIGNTIDTTGDASRGINVDADGASGLTITGNTFTAEANDSSVRGLDVVDINISNNDFTGPGGLVPGYAVLLSGITGTSSISGNDIDGYGSGIMVYGGVTASGSDTGAAGLTISDNTIINCAEGIELGYSLQDYDMTTVTVTDNTLTDNDIAIYVSDGAHVLADQFLIEYNYMSGSISYGVRNVNALTVNAAKNWWDSNTGPRHESNPLGVGDPVSDNVIYQPWLDNADQPEDSTDDYIDAITDASTEVFIYNAGGGHVVSAGRWSHNPDHAYPTFMVVGGYFIDVVVEDDTGFDADTEIEIRFHYTDADVDAGLVEATFIMKWWNGTEWLDCSDTGVNTAGNYVWVKIRDTGTSPTLADMNGTPFAASGQRVVIPGLTTWGALALAVLFLAAVVVAVRRRKRATVRVED